MNVFVTGGAGFQGSHLVEMLLARGHFVRVLNTPSLESRANLATVARHKNLEVVWGSVTDAETVNKAARECEVVLHLAAQVNVDVSLERPLETAHVNVDGTLNVLEAVRRHRARLIHASTCEVYGSALRIPMAEDHPLNPHSPYAATKAAADRLVYAYYRSYGIDAVIVRPFNIFGPRQKYRAGGAVVPIFIKQVSEGQAPTINGTGEQTRDYLFVEDLVEAYRMVLDASGLSGKVINFGSGQETSVSTIARTVIEALGSKLQPVHRPGRPGEVSRFVADVRQARELGFAPRVSFKEGVQRTVKWWTHERLRAEEAAKAALRTAGS